ncbi:MAG: hypothetical protein JSS35_03635 [Proteobacteria bacterium]|nr:hypothetical protein [Pseudomonadota bacterium]
MTPASIYVLFLFMHEAAASSERREEILGELAEWMHAAAREAQRRLLEAETTDDFAKLTVSLAKLARGVRQSILLHRKLETERLAAAERADAAAASDAGTSEVVSRHLKRVRLRTAITRHVWNALDGDEAAELFRDDLNARLDELERAPDFLDAPIDDLIFGLCRELGFAPPPARAPEPSGAGAQTGALEGAAQGAGPNPGGPSPGGPALHAPNTS